MRGNEETVQALVRPARPLSRVVVRVINGKNRDLTADLLPGLAVSIGKSPDNQLVLDDMTVSRYHLELTLRRGDIEVRDLDSMNGTYIGDLRIERALVRPGTQLVVGTNTLVLTAEPGELPERKPEPEGLPELPGVIAKSPAMRKVLQYAARLAGSNVSALIQGETGTGKEVIARAIHELSPRKDRPFEVVDCGSMAPSLIASELFGHERGAFTGAHSAHAGAFERADGGSVFLDEIGELPLDLQPMLLGVLARKRFKRVGGVRERTVDVRVIAATHRDLRNATNLGTFRADLYFRLAVARVVIPPLRERIEDIAPLVRCFAEQLSGDPGSQPFDGPALTALEAHPWSGNVRELRNVVESAVALGSLVLEENTSPETLLSNGLGDLGLVSDDVLALPYREARARAVAAFERSYLRKLAEACVGNASEAARRAKMDRPYLLGLLRKHGFR
jgi:DNA-binding NtrC family response regulator